LLGTLIGELFASDQGLGFMLIRAMEAHKVLDIGRADAAAVAFARNCEWVVARRRAARAPAVSAGGLGRKLDQRGCGIRERKDTQPDKDVTPSIDAAVEWR